MTREDAIKILEQLKRIDDMILESPKNFFAINMAIKALEQLTSYEQTINKLTEAISEQKNVLDEMFENIKTEIDFIPTYGAKFADGSINVHVNKKDVLQIIDKYRGEEDGKID